MTRHIANRDRIVETLIEELVGPSPQGDEIDCTRPVRFSTREESYGPWKQQGSGEEILQRDPPFQRYGVGVLSPMEVPGRAEDVELEALSEALVSDDSGASSRQPHAADTQAADQAGSAQIHGVADSETDDFELSAANALKPSSIAVSFLADIPTGSTIAVEATGGRYHQLDVSVGDQKRTWWLRSSVVIRAEFSSEAVQSDHGGKRLPTTYEIENGQDLDIRIEMFVREYEASTSLITVCLVNRTRSPLLADESMLFQSEFSVYLKDEKSQPWILPYPGPPTAKLDHEEQSLELLYRNVQTYAVGHGCSADWERNAEHMVASRIYARSLPIVEVPSITPDIVLEDGNLLEVPMAPLAGLIPGNDGTSVLWDVVHRYDEWVEARRSEIPHLDERFRGAATRHVNECSRSVQRMLGGLRYLEQSPVALRAFQLANHAVLLQQIHTPGEPRRLDYDARAKRIVFSEQYVEPDPVTQTSRGKWRAFQIAFLLATIQSTAEGSHADRETVELIWFPTGGGKTEAYLGLTAFSLFMRRLCDQSDAGVHVLMRYTLRLLTAQQFQRASGLICAMEYLRKSVDGLGQDEFSIGIWLGASTTPNSRQVAISSLKDLQRGDRYAENQFVLDRCPWCAAQMGPVQVGSRHARSVPRVHGYVQRGETVVFECPDRTCAFSTGLPIYVIDEDIYERRPSLVIGTVDKFAMLAWRPQARALFGLDSDGGRVCAPPGLIIQDELHLISGPLGSVVGLYETVIDELCTDRRSPEPVVPKIVSSTATIRRYQEQIKALYARENVALFPPPGLDAGDAFFARYARDENGNLQRGRMYVGVHAPGLGSLQTTQARVFSSLLQAPFPLSPEERDPWWTLLVFFNSLRDLGTAMSLFQSRVPDYLGAIQTRLGIGFSELRHASRVKELTSRLRSDHVPAAITELEVRCTSSSDVPIDACLASSIIEVGIDIDRLSLMTVVGQPKTTAQYIQVSGRVGRQWQSRPGLVVTILSPTRPRDRSHFERFRSYHERLYAQVEPTSVTPFSPPALDRALHAVMVAYARMVGDDELAASPHPFPADIVETLKGIMHRRVSIVDPQEQSNLDRVFGKRAREWRQWKRTYWDKASPNSDYPLLRMAGAYVDDRHAPVSWSTPMSMRNVDAECQAEISLLYLNDTGDSDA